MMEDCLSNSLKEKRLSEILIIMPSFNFLLFSYSEQAKVELKVEFSPVKEKNFSPKNCEEKAKIRFI